MVGFLAMCENLNNLDLTNNEITKSHEYRQQIRLAIPTLLILDGFGFDDTFCDANDKPNSSSVSSSSLTSDISKELSSSSCEQDGRYSCSRRPISATNFGRSQSNDFSNTFGIRPKTGGSSFSI